MLHQFARTFVLAQDRPARGLPALHVPLSPAAYLRLRREAAGLTIEQVADRIAPSHDERRMAADLVRNLETPGTTARRPATLDRLLGAFPFDLAVYLQLHDTPAHQHPRICRGCGCSQWDPCETGQGGACAWASLSACTRCVGDDATDAETAQ